MAEVPLENPALDEILDDEGDEIMDQLADKKKEPLLPTISIYMVRKLLDFPKTKIRFIVSKHADYSSII